MPSVPRRESDAVDISFSDRDEILGLYDGIFKLVVSRNMLFELVVTRPFESLCLGVVTADWALWNRDFVGLTPFLKASRIDALPTFRQTSSRLPLTERREIEPSLVVPITSAGS